jgi:hypothetical protein
MTKLLSMQNITLGFLVSLELATTIDTYLYFRFDKMV